MLLPPPTAPHLRGSFTRRSGRACHADQCSVGQRSRADCRFRRRILWRGEVWTKSVDVDQSFGDKYAGNTDALFDMVDRNSVQIQFPTAPDVASKGKAIAVTDERSCFIDSAAHDCHWLAHTGELSANPVGSHSIDKLHIDFCLLPSIGSCMAKLETDEIRNLFTAIGCIMEDASLIALVWRTDDGWGIDARYQKLLDAHRKIGELLSRIESAT